MEKADPSLLKKILQSIKGVIKVEEEKDPVLEHLLWLKNTADTGNTVSLEEFNNDFDRHLCELYSGNKPSSH
ncbi:MAG: hypothetical protein L6264_00825 [Weeksellaceae bacterium]|nr:hypothetical protein [Bacteroidota bacterium]MCG2779463.1 hypothetical protein [Weeksellaceae bacterium]